MIYKYHDDHDVQNISNYILLAGPVSSKMKMLKIRTISCQK